MRLKTHIFVSAFLRNQQLAGAFATLIRKGNEDAGIVFVVQRCADGTQILYGQASRSYGEDFDDIDRNFEILAEQATNSTIDEKLQAQIKFDPDCWIIEIEGPVNLTLLNLASNPAH